jgi:hypothetical protein
MNAYLEEIHCDRLPVFLSDFRLDKKFLETNTLAYFAAASVTRKKVS